ncbi:hypothetical protein Nepgr_007943 [Nepenthes gracilis]|uniref:Uncharacterized protein n=1 Tax=Nepenthes gracilis TaxID=150966 RepID=A0AAD3XIS4_NEPGR|nr:hypothetical protein Nepgr_007943 [Nepenthes gracilis]
MLILDWYGDGASFSWYTGCICTALEALAAQKLGQMSVNCLMWWAPSSAEGWLQHVPSSSAGLILYSWDPHLPPSSGLVRDSIMVVELLCLGEVAVATLADSLLVVERDFPWSCWFFHMDCNLILG